MFKILAAATLSATLAVTSVAPAQAQTAGQDRMGQIVLGVGVLAAIAMALNAEKEKKEEASRAAPREVHRHRNVTKVVKQEPRPVVVRQQRPVIVQNPRPVVTKKPRPVVIQQPRPVIQRYSRPMVIEQPRPAVRRYAQPKTIRQPHPVFVRAPDRDDHKTAYRRVSGQKVLPRRCVGRIDNARDRSLVLTHECLRASGVTLSDLPGSCRREMDMRGVRKDRHAFSQSCLVQRGYAFR